MKTSRLLVLLALPAVLAACGPGDVAILRINNPLISADYGEDVSVSMRDCPELFYDPTPGLWSEPSEGGTVPQGESKEFKLTPGCHDVAAYRAGRNSSPRRYYLAAGDVVEWSF